MVPSASISSDVYAPNGGGWVENFRVDSQHHLMYTRGSYFGEEHNVPGTENWQAQNVKGVLDSHNNVECFVNGRDGHLWGITHYASGGWSNWTDFNRNFLAFDAAADGDAVQVAGIDYSHVLWQISGNAGGSWGYYWNPGGTAFGFQDVTLWAEGGSGGQSPGSLNALDVYTVGQDHQVWWLHEPNAQGGAWTNVGGNFDHVNARQEAANGMPFILAWQGTSDYPTVYQNWLTYDGSWYGWTT